MGYMDRLDVNKMLFKQIKTDALNNFGTLNIQCKTIQNLNCDDEDRFDYRCELGEDCIECNILVLKWLARPCYHWLVHWNDRRYFSRAHYKMNQEKIEGAILIPSYDDDDW